MKDLQEISIGLDLSINSTGVAVLINKIPIKYYIITSKLTNKLKAFKNNYIEYILYDKQELPKTDEYYIRETKKTQNILSIVENIKIIINSLKQTNKLNNITAYIEGISYSSSSSTSLADLAGLNYLVRNMLTELNINFFVISPSSNKKFAVGIGNVEKDVIINAWKCCQPMHIKNIDEIKNNTLKLDDIADAYFLASHDFS